MKKETFMEGGTLHGRKKPSAEEGKTFAEEEGNPSPTKAPGFFPKARGPLYVHQNEIQKAAPSTNWCMFFFNL